MPKISQVTDVYNRYFNSKIQYTYESYPRPFHYNPDRYYRIFGVPPSSFSGKLDGVDGCLKRMDTNSELRRLGSEEETTWLQQVTSTGNKTRARDFCIALAASLQFKKQVILMDAGHTGIAEYFGAPAKPGVSEILSSKTSIGDCLLRYKQENGSTICLIPHGGGEIDYSEVSIQKLCDDLRTVGLPVIISTPSIEDNRSVVTEYGRCTSNTYGLFLFDTLLDDVNSYKEYFEGYSIEYLLVASRVPHEIHPQYQYVIPGLYDKLRPAIRQSG